MKALLKCDKPTFHSFPHSLSTNIPSMQDCTVYDIQRHKNQLAGISKLHKISHVSAEQNVLYLMICTRYETHSFLISCVI